MAEQRRRKLDELGFIWNVDEAGWEEGYSYLKRYKDREGHCRVPLSHEENEFRFGGWVRTQRVNGHSLPPECRRRLDALGFVWNPFQSDWEDGFRYLKSYNDREGHCRVPTNHNENGFRLGQRVGNRRANRNTLSDEKRRQLDELGFVWAPFQSDWEEGYRYLKRYKGREGHCRVPLSHEENEFRLGLWARGQRRDKDRMSEERRQRLDQLEFVWDPAEWAWEQGLSRLKSYKDREGHCRVPMSHQEDGVKLGQWVSTQRAKASSLSKQRRRLLEQLGFDWRLR